MQKRAHAVRAVARHLKPIALALLAAGWAAPAAAIDYVWRGGTGAWETAANWQPGLGTPGTGDSATVSTGEASLASNRTLAGFTLIAGAVSGTGALTVAGPATWRGGELTGAGTHRFEGSTTLTGSAGKSLTGGRELQLAGPTTWGGNTAAGANYLFFYGGTLNNTGAFTDANAFNTYARDYSGSNVFNNAGSYTKTGSSVTTLGVAFNNTGSVAVNAGRLELSGGGTSTGSFAIASGAVVDLTSGTQNLNNLATSGAGTLEISGSTSYSFVNVNGGTHSARLLVSGGNLQGTGATFTGPVTWAGGAITGAGTHRFEGATSITGNAGKSLSDGRELQLAGPTTWGGNTAAGANYLFFYGGTLNNTGAFTDANAFNTYARDYSGSNVFNNAGSYTKTGSSVTTLGVAFNNTGSTRVAAGTLLLQPAFNNRGLIDLAAGATLAVASASFVNTGILQGNGLLRTAANGALLNNGVLAAGARLQVGALGLDGDLTMGGVGVLDVDLASLSSFDTLSVTDAVTLRGAVAVHGLAGYVPKVGEHFTVLTFNQRLAASTFDRVTWQGAGGVLLTAQYNLHDVTLTVVAVPEPATWALWLAGLVVGLGRGARQRAAARR